MNSRRRVNSNVGHLSMTRQKILAIRISSLLGGAFFSFAIPAIMLGSDVNSELAWRIFAPGFGVVPVIHNVLPAIILTVIIDAFVYCIVAFVAANLFIGFYNARHRRRFNGDAQQIVGPERG